MKNTILELIASSKNSYELADRICEVVEEENQRVRNEIVVDSLRKLKEYEVGATAICEQVEKQTIHKILGEVVKNGSATRESIIIDLTRMYKQLTGVDIPPEDSRRDVGKGKKVKG